MKVRRNQPKGGWCKAAIPNSSYVDTIRRRNERVSKKNGSESPFRSTLSATSAQKKTKVNGFLLLLMMMMMMTVTDRFKAKLFFPVEGPVSESFSKDKKKFCICMETQKYWFQ